MRTIIAIIFAVCVLNASVKADTEGCTDVNNQLKDNLQLFYSSGKEIIDAGALTP